MAIEDYALVFKHTGALEWTDTNALEFDIIYTQVEIKYTVPSRTFILDPDARIFVFDSTQRTI